MVCRVWMIVVTMIWINGCTAVENRAMPAAQLRSIEDIYAASTAHAEEDVAAFVNTQMGVQQTFGYVEPYYPVISPPVVKKVWVPDHPSKHTEALVGGHWVYLMLQDSKWLAGQERGQSIVNNHPIKGEQHD